MHPVIIASAMLSTAIVTATFGPRLLPEATVDAAPGAQACAGHVGYYSPGLNELNVHDDAFAAFQAEIVSDEIDLGNDIQVLDFEEVGGRVVFFYSTGC